MGDDGRLSSLSISQEKLLSLIGVVPGFLSILGSTTIIYKNLCNLSSSTPYDRLVFALSVCDIVATVSFVLSPFLIPSGEQAKSVRVYAIGTDGSCSLLGWLTQFGFSAVAYNGALSCYYLSTVRFKVSRKDFGEKYEKWIHATILGFFVVTATMGSSIGLFNELDLGFGCWANDFPDGCVDDECTSRFFGWVIGAIPTLVTLILIIVNNLVVYRYVRSQFHKTNPEDDTNLVEEAAFGSPEYERKLRQATQLREVATQGFFYVGSFFLCYTCAFIVRTLESMLYTQEDEADIYILLVLNYFLIPLQGFFNMLIYNRPNYTRVRAAYPEQGRLWAMKYVCFNGEIPKLIEISLSRSQAASGRVTGQKRDNSSSGTQKRISKFSSDLAPISEHDELSASDRGGPSLSMRASQENKGTFGHEEGNGRTEESDNSQQIAEFHERLLGFLVNREAPTNNSEERNVASTNESEERNLDLTETKVPVRLAMDGSLHSHEEE